jgi:hypothetical protein
MSKSQIAALVLAIVGGYSFMNGKKGTDTSSIIGTWAPLAVAAYVFLM